MRTLDEVGRLLALREILINNSQPHERFDRIVKYAATFFETPIAGIQLIGEDSAWYKAVEGLPQDTKFPREITFCTHAILNDDIMVVEDASIDQRFQDNPLVTGSPNIVFYAGAPLKLPSGFVIGAFCIIDQKPRSLSESDLKLLACLRDVVVNELLHLDTQNQVTKTTAQPINELISFVELLGRYNLHTALRYLNSRTPHRYTAVYKFNEEELQSVCLVDKYDSEVKQGETVFVSTSYCSTLPSVRVLDMMTHIPNDYPRVEGSLVEAYGGVLITDENGNPFGSLCHFDYKRCEVNRNDIPLLQKTAPLIYKYLRDHNQTINL